MPSRAIVAYAPTPMPRRPRRCNTSHTSVAIARPLCCCLMTTSSVGLASAAEVAPAANAVARRSECVMSSRPVAMWCSALYAKLEPNWHAVMGAMEPMLTCGKGPRLCAILSGCAQVKKSEGAA